MNKRYKCGSRKKKGPWNVTHVDVCWVIVPTNTVSRLRMSGKLGLGPARAIKFNNTTFCGYIRVLLIKTNSTIYICYIKYGGNADICVLAVGDDELSVGDDDALSRRLPKDGARVGWLEDHVGGPGPVMWRECFG
jgi:hypothetical protein